MELINIIKTRRSARSYKATAIPEKILLEMLDAARMAPSPGNSQSTYYGVIQDSEIKEKLARAAGNQMWIAQAPVVIACCSDLSWDIAKQPEEDFGLLVNKLRFNSDFVKYLCEYPDSKARTTLFENAAPLIGAEHIILTGTAYGLSACIVGFLDIAEANKILQLPEHITCLYLLPVGYTTEAPCDKKSKKLEEIVFYNIWK